MAQSPVQQEARSVDLLRFTTAGSVDDGKSTLIGRLLYDCKSIFEDQLHAVENDSRRLNRSEPDLALLTDGLKAEREQGITIDVAYRYFATPRRRFIIADTPGHEQYTRNMVTGASTANLAIILVDARQGVLTQSRRHGFIASLLGIPHIILAVNKMDLVDYSQAVFEQIKEDYTQFASRLRMTELTGIPISALRGDNVVRAGNRMPWYRGVTLLDHLENVYIGSDRNLIDFRFPVQYVNRPHQDFRGYTGQIVSGVVRVGDEVMALPSGRTTRIRSIETYDGPLAFAFPPQSVTLCLEDEIDLSRGEMLVHPNNLPHIGEEVEAILIWMDVEPFQPGKTYLVKHTTRLTKGVFSKLHYRINPDGLHREPCDYLALNEIGRTILQLHHPIFFDEYERNRQTGALIVIDPLSNRTVGAGILISRGKPHVRISPRITSGVPVSRNIMNEKSLVTTEDRQQILGHKAVTLWLTGLSGSGKSTLAKMLEKRLLQSGHICYVLDGDNIRQGLNRDLGFSAEDRSENIRRVAETARLMNEAGLIVITAFISPFREDRRQAGEIIGTDRFREVYVEAPLEVCEERDPKGLYRKARSGRIPEFTGIASPYEPPETPSWRIRTDRISVEEAVATLFTGLQLEGILQEKE